MSRLYWTQSRRKRVLDRYGALLRDSPVPTQQQHVKTCCGETFVLSSGEVQAPPLVLLHGGNTNSLMWLRSLPAWTQHYRVHAVDTIGDPGFSATTRPAFDSDTYALWLEDVWRALDIARATVVAASFGGWIALDFVIRRPERVERLALLSPAGIVRMDPVSQLRVAGLTLLGARGRRKALDITFGPNPDDVDVPSLNYLQFQGLVQTDFVSRIGLPAVIPEALLRAVNMPVLVVLGDQDIFFRADRVQQRLQACLPGAQVIRLPGVGHGLGNPTDLVTRFLAEQ